VRHTINGLRRAPGFALAAILSIAVGVGAATTIFSVASALLLRPLPYKDADRLVILWNRSPGLGITEDWFSTAQYFDLKNGHQGFDDLAIAIGGVFTLAGDGEPERIGTIRMSSNLLPMLGARAMLGRLFTPEEDRPGRSGTAILRHATWRRRYGGDPAVIGRTIRLNDQPYEIVGVLAPEFSLPREVMPTLNGAEDADVVVPLPLGPEAAAARGQEDYNIVGRLRRGTTVAAAQAEADAITARLRREHPDLYPPNGGLTFGIVPLQEQVVGDVRRALLVLLGSVGFVLLIACANVANLQLARALARHRELAVRAALGATRRRLAADVLAESAVVAAAGGALGVALAAAGVSFIRALGTESVPRLGEVGLNLGVLAFSVAVSALSGLLFGIVPALKAGGGDVHEGLRDAGRGSAGSGSVWGRGNRTRRLLVAGEIALAIVLLVGAGLLVRSFNAVHGVWPGFETGRSLTFELSASPGRYPNPPAVAELYRQLIERLARVPGVDAAGAVSALPLSQMFAWGPVTVEGRAPAPGEAFINADMRMVSGRYFEALEIPLRAGRFFDDHDVRDGQRVVIVDERMARELWPGASALGKRLRTGGASSTTPWLTVVGIVGDVKQYTLDGDSRIALYFPHTQFTARSMNLVVRTSGDPASLAAAVRREVRAVDPDLPIYRLRTMRDRLEESLARRRFAMWLLTIFAGIALTIAAIGVYGVMAYLVNQGTREIGIRLALGATPAAVLAMVLRRGLAVALAGVAAGLAAATVLTRLMSSLLFRVEPTDPVTYGLVAVVLTGVALAASWIPARKASHVDPIMTIRDI
jgi:predicted permease